MKGKKKPTHVCYKICMYDLNPHIHKRLIRNPILNFWIGIFNPLSI